MATTVQPVIIYSETMVKYEDFTTEFTVEDVVSNLGIPSIALIECKQDGKPLPGARQIISGPLTASHYKIVPALAGGGSSSSGGGTGAAPFVFADFIATSNEGFPHDQIVTNRTKSVEAMMEAIKQKRFILVKGTPFSGKTGFIDLLVKYIHPQVQANNVQLYRVSMLRADVDYQWDSFWQRETGKEWSVTISSSTPTIIFIDEGQLTYDTSKHGTGALWRVIKDGMGNSKGYRKLAIVIFACYGSHNLLTVVGTPFTFPIEHVVSIRPQPDFGLPGLYLNEGECEEMYTAFKATYWELEGYIKQYIFWITVGHLGLLRTVLRFIARKFNAATLQSDIYFHLHTASMGDLLAGARGQPPESIIQSAKQRAVCDAAVSGTIVTNPAHKRTATKLVKAGVIVEVADGGYEFPSPLYERTYLKFRYSPIVDAASLTSLGDFLQQVLQRMDASHLANAYKQGYKSKPLESLWQNEFYHIAREILPPDCMITPNSGGKHSKVKDGYPDFYIDSNLEWMVEILREGLDMKEHAQRFTPTGKYAHFMNKIKEWVLVDFRSDKKRVKAVYPNMWHVSYSADFVQFTILHPDGSKEVLHPQGAKLKLSTMYISEQGKTPKKINK